MAAKSLKEKIHDSYIIIKRLKNKYENVLKIQPFLIIVFRHILSKYIIAHPKLLSG